MMELWTTILLKPMYNGLIFLIEVFPGGSLALAIILLTIVVRLILAPISKRSIVTQIKQKRLQPELDAIKERIKDPKKQSTEIFALYKKNKVNPFSSILLLLIQLPIILALYHVLKTGIEENTELLYSFIQYPEVISSSLLGFVDLATKSVWLALLAGITQYIQIKLSPAFQQAGSGEPKNDQEKMAQSLQKKMVFSMPIMIMVFAYMLPSAIALYWSVSNIYTLLQELYIRRKYEKDNGVEDEVKTN